MLNSVILRSKNQSPGAYMENGYELFQDHPYNDDSVSAQGKINTASLYTPSHYLWTVTNSSSLLLQYPNDPRSNPRRHIMRSRSLKKRVCMAYSTMRHLWIKQE